MHVQSLQFSLDENQWQQDWGILISLASQPGLVPFCLHWSKSSSGHLNCKNWQTKLLAITMALENVHLLHFFDLKSKNLNVSVYFCRCCFGTNTRFCISSHTSSPDYCVRNQICQELPWREHRPCKVSGLVSNMWPRETKCHLPLQEQNLWV